MSEKQFFAVGVDRNSGSGGPLQNALIMEDFSKREPGTCGIRTYKWESLRVGLGTANPEGSENPLAIDTVVILTKYENTAYDGRLFFETRAQVEKSIGRFDNVSQQVENAYSIPINDEILRGFEETIARREEDVRSYVEEHNKAFEDAEIKSGLDLSKRPISPDVEPFTPEYQPAIEKYANEWNKYYAKVEPYIEHVPPVLTHVKSTKLIEGIEYFLDNLTASGFEGHNTSSIAN